MYATSVDDIIVLPESPYDSLTFQAKLYDYASNGVSGEYTRLPGSPPVETYSRITP